MMRTLLISSIARRATSRCCGRAAATAPPTTQLTMRTYRGDSGEAQVLNLSPKEQALVDVALPRSKAILERHEQLPNLEHIPRASFDTANPGVDTPTAVRQKRLIYRAKQRGWLEVDLLLGTWANENVPSLSPTELDEFEAFCNMETIDIYNIVTLRLDIPEQYKTDAGDSVMERIQTWARGHPLGKADPDTYKAVKKDNNLI